MNTDKHTKVYLNVNDEIVFFFHSCKYSIVLYLSAILTKIECCSTVIKSLIERFRLEIEIAIAVYSYQLGSRDIWVSL